MHGEGSSHAGSVAEELVEYADSLGTGYEEELFRDRMTEIIQAHDAGTPLYLNYDSKVAHYPQQAPVEYQQKFSFITDSVNRMMYHSMVNYLDDNLANVTVRPSAVIETSCLQAV